MRGKVLTLMSLFIISGVKAQSNVRYSQLNFAQGMNNPAALALDGSIMVDIIARNQWMGVEGAPMTFAMNGQYELMSDMAVGLNVFHDRIGVTETTSFQGQYAYRLLFNNARALAFGVGVGADNYILDYAGSATTTAFDPAFARSHSRVVFNSSVGAYYYSPKFYAGFSMPQMYTPGFKTSGKATINLDLHYYLSTGFYLGQGNYVFNPHFQLKAVPNAPLAGDIVLRNTFMNRFSIVLGYRTENSLIAGFDVLITPMVRAGYSFNHDVGRLSSVKGISNELYIGMAFPYRNSREDFGGRRYIGRKGGFKSDYKRTTNRNNKRRLIHR
jgi:type IX secretion system PorP/SprF family membrane protein